MTIQINVGGRNICFMSIIGELGVSIDDNLNFDDHVKRICFKTNDQIFAQQHLRGLVDLPDRKAIYSSVTATSFIDRPLFFIIIIVMIMIMIIIMIIIIIIVIIIIIIIVINIIIIIITYHYNYYYYYHHHHD